MKRSKQEKSFQFQDFSTLTTAKIPTGIPQLDALLGGGIPEGKLTILVGLPSAGKSTLGLQLLRQLAHNYEKDNVLYIDSEKSVTSERILQLLGQDSRILSRIKRFSPFTFEEVTKEIIKILLGKVDFPIKGIVWDSIVASPLQKEVDILEGISEEEKTTTFKGGEIPTGLFARMMGLFLKVIIPLLDYNNVPLIAINQYRAKMSLNPYQPTPNLYGEKGSMPGGYALHHYAYIMLELTRSSFIKNKSGDITGAIVKARTLKNKQNSPGIAHLVLDYQKGFDPVLNLIFFAKDSSIIRNTAGYIAYRNKKYREKELEEALRKDQKLFDSLKNDCLQEPAIIPTKEEIIAEETEDEGGI